MERLEKKYSNLFGNEWIRKRNCCLYFSHIVLPAVGAAVCALIRALFISLLLFAFCINEWYVERKLPMIPRLEEMCLYAKKFNYESKIHFPEVYE